MSAACYFCASQIKPDDAVNFHHPVYQSRGGKNVEPSHKSCHVGFHSSQNDFREWGRKGGQRTAARGYWIFNLMRGKNPPDPLLHIPFGRA